MEKNENGLPRARQMTESGRDTNNAAQKNAMPPVDNGASQNGENAKSKSDNGMRGRTNSDCGEMIDSCLDSRPLAYVYAPNQRFCMLYSASDALDHGTLFEQLYKPVEVYGRE